MADWTTRKTTTTRHEWLVRVPTNQTQVQQMLHMAQVERDRLLDRPANPVRYDTDILLTIGDDTIVVYFEINGVI